MSLTAIIARRKQALLHDFVHLDLPPLVEVESLEALAGMGFLEEFEPDETEEQVGRRSRGSVAIRRGQGNPDSAATLWVKASYTGYRGAYLGFVRQVYGISATSAELSGHDVDHLLNRARTGNPDVFLRIEAIPSAANQAWGRVFEKSASQAAVAGNRRVRRLMSYAIAAKVAGLTPPVSSADRAGIAAIEQHFAALGLSGTEVRSGMENILSHIERNL